MLSKLETGKDAVQELAESAATHVGRIATIVAGAVRDVTHEFGEWASDALDVRESTTKARGDI